MHPGESANDSKAISMKMTSGFMRQLLPLGADQLLITQSAGHGGIGPNRQRRCLGALLANVRERETTRNFRMQFVRTGRRRHDEPGEFDCMMSDLGEAATSSAGRIQGRARQACKSMKQ